MFATIKSSIGERVRRAGFQAALIAALLGGARAPAAGAEKPALTVSAEPRGTAFNLKLRVTSTRAHSLFYVRNSGKTELKELRLSAHLHETERPRGAAELKLSSPGRKLDDGSLNLAADAEIAVELDASGLPAEPRTGYLAVASGGEQFTLTQIALDYVPPEVRFVGSTDREGLKGTTKEGRFERVFTLQSQNETSIEALRTPAIAMTGPDGVQRPATLSPGVTGTTPVPLPGLAYVDVRIATDTPLAGDYKGTILLAYGDKPQEVPLTITRVKGPLPYKILPIDAVRAEAHDCALTPVRVLVHEENGTAVTAGLPQLHGLTTAATGQKPFQTRFDKLDWIDDSGASVTSLAFKPGETRSLWLRIHGLDDVGEHSGDLRLSLPDGQTVEAKVTIIAKRPWLVALALIALGILLSEGLKLLASRGLNLQQRRRLLEIDVELGRLLADTTLGEAGERVLRALRARVRALSAESRILRRADHTAAIAEIEAKMKLTPRWAAARAAAAALPTVSEEVLKSLDELERFLVASDSPSADLTAKATKLAEVEATIKEATRKSLRDAAKQIAERIQGLRDDPFGSDELNGRLKSIDEALKPADALALDGKFVDAARLIGAARKSVAVALLADLERRTVDKPEVLEIRRWPGDWGPIADKLLEQLERAKFRAGDDPDRAMPEYYRGRARYLRAAVEALVAFTQKKLDDLRALPEPPAGDAGADERRRRQEQVKLLDDELKTWLAFREKLKQFERSAEVEPKTLFEIEQDVQEYVAEPAKAAAAASRAGLAAVSGGTRHSATLPGSGGVGLTPAADQIRLRELSGLAGQIVRNELFVLGLSAVVAAILGLKLLWVDDVDWGTFGDCIWAVLWGLGLHQATDQAFNFNKLVTDLTATKPPAAAD